MIKDDDGTEEDIDLNKNETIIQKLKSSVWEIMTIPTTRNVTIAGMFRKFGDMIITCYIPLFFLKNYPNFKAEYALINAIMLASLGFASNIISGIIGDKFEQSNPMTKSLLCIYSSIISVPLIALCCWGHGNFWISMAAMSIFVFVSGGSGT